MESGESSDSSPGSKAARREHAVLFANALEALPASYRDVIVMRHLEEMCFPDIAKRMERSLDSVKNLWLRALTKLRRSLVPEKP